MTNTLGVLIMSPVKACEAETGGGRRLAARDPAGGLVRGHGWICSSGSGDVLRHTTTKTHQSTDSAPDTDQERRSRPAAEGRVSDYFEFTH